MNNTTLSPAQLTHLANRNPDGTLRGGLLAEAGAQSLGRAIAPAPAGSDEYQASAEYLWQNTDRGSVPTDAVVAAAHAWALELADTVPEEWLPEVDLLGDDEDGDDGAENTDSMYDDEGMITSLHELNDPKLARGMCVQTSEAIGLYLNQLPAEQRPHAYKVIQGMPAPSEELNCHYALLVTMQDGDVPVIVDFTYAQVDADAPFPLVEPAAVWEARMLADLGRPGGDS